MTEMDFNDFEQLVQDLQKRRPMWFVGDAEGPASDEQLAVAEKLLGVTLPNEYKQFVQCYGGGYFAMTNVFSANPESEWFIVARQKDFQLGDGFVAVTDDETGGAYGFVVEKGKCSERVFYFHPDDGSPPVEQYPSFLTYLAKVGLQQVVGR